MQSLITLERIKYIFAPIAVMCFVIILTLIYTTGDNITLGDYNTIRIILVAALLISLCMIFVSIMNNFILYWGIAMSVLLAVSVVLMVMSPFILQYYEDCSELLTLDGSYNNLNTLACVQHATDNPNATGDEIIQAIQTESLKQKKIKDISILDRPMEK